MQTIVTRSATFSPCRRFRYSLWRHWGSRPAEDKQFAMFIGLNPSTADEQNDDPTIRRCIAYAQYWGYDALCMANLFAYRATNPSEMMAQQDPIGDENDKVLVDLAATAGVVVAAWGTGGTHMGRDQQVRALIPNLHCLRLTKAGHPGHPLYLPKLLTPFAFATIKEESS